MWLVCESFHISGKFSKMFIEKNPRVGGLAQFKPMFKGQLYF